MRKQLRVCVDLLVEVFEGLGYSAFGAESDELIFEVGLRCRGDLGSCIINLLCKRGQI